MVISWGVRTSTAPPNDKAMGAACPPDSPSATHMITCPAPPDLEWSGLVIYSYTNGIGRGQKWSG